MSEREPRPNFGSPEISPEQGTYKVVAATPNDLEDLKAAIPPPDDDPEQYEFLLEQQEQDKGKLLVLREGSEVAGSANLIYDWQSPHAANIKGSYLDAIAVAEKHRGKRLVDKLLNAGEQEAKARGRGEIYLGVYTDNQSAIKSYERNGYEAVADTAHTLPKEVDPEQIPEVYYRKSLR